MALPVLTWLSAAETLIKVTTPTYADFLNAVETKVNASTHWKVNKKTLDAPNNRGYVELAPKSAVAGVTEGRILLLFSTGTVAGAAGSERPLKACRVAPNNTEDAGLTCKMWAGFSPDANSGIGGPTNDPWTNATPYGASPQWSQLFALNNGIPAANGTLGIIESAEGICLYWSDSTGSNLQGIIGGRMMESLDGNTGYWMLSGLKSALDSQAAGPGWNTIPSQNYLPPLGYGALNNSSNGNNGPWAVAFKSGVLYGIGRNWELINYGAGNYGYSGPDGALLQSVILCGGPYYSGQSGAFQGLMRQVRWGPDAYRLQRLYSSGVEQAICFNYANSASGAKPGGLWFDHFR